MYNLKQITKIIDRVKLYSNEFDELVIMCPIDMLGTTACAKDYVYNATEVLQPITDTMISRKYSEDAFTKNALVYLDKVSEAIDKAIDYYRETEEVKDWRDFIDNN